MLRPYHLLLAVFCHVCIAYTISGQLSNVTTYDPARIFIRLVSLEDFSVQQTTLHTDYSFLFEVAENSEHELFVESLDYQFVPNRVFVEVVEDEVRGYRHSPGTPYVANNNTEVALPLAVEVERPRQYLEVRNDGLFQSGPLAAIWNNKLMLFGILVTGAILFGPSVLEMVNPEYIETFKDAQRQGMQTPQGIKLD
ncbi:hypothetical protein BABINDRAFT_165501 [Babjeviella inositovora NRRL Y-12698]|uniref:Protein SOP4 n=1 Tax=Babjeviella inositovora NRRL Y-12698 TaxID=984486 RepID=A0A1E3QWE4_9ASCO|nr:uncharacterized protein BABINDRAFT_165501 [Babjeviella inositovora NRRL Y-12698]ODQ81998.1 hypothetical protein BABINDRAFT_165501 [Babjeviella inositovora NRRL Y-12698]